jgi:hypothetical protein
MLRKFLVGLVLTAIIQSLLWVPRLASAVDVSKDIPANAFSILPEISKQVNLLWDTHPNKAYFPALIELESCVSYTSTRCFSPTSKLKSTREEGAGLGQITRTYNNDGSIRFDMISEMAARYAELRQLTWENVYTRPDLQIRAIVLMSKGDDRTLSAVKDPMERLKFVDASYNQGVGRTLKERMICGLRKGCDPQKWDGNVALVTTATGIIYGRPAYEISRHHVEQTTTVRINKYKNYL